MTERIKNIYTYLITNRLHELKGWHDSYVAFTQDIDHVGQLLKAGYKLTDKETYQNTSFKALSDPFKDSDKGFAYRLLYQKSNGIASRGQSVLSKENFTRFINSQHFVQVLQELIRHPELHENYQAFQKAWSDQKAGNNPVLVNRVVAACTTQVSTTVDEAKFSQIYAWLIDQRILDKPATPAVDWYQQNSCLMQSLKKAFESEAAAQNPDKPVDAHWLSMFVWEMFTHISNPFSLKKQVVKYGAPGTGKTYTALQNTELQFKIWQQEYKRSSKPEEHIETLQFHPSYSYEDFIEGLRPVLDAQQQAQLQLQNGVFKELCIRAGKWEVDFYKEAGQEKAEKWDTLTINDLAPYKEKLKEDHWNYIWQIPDKTKLIAEAVPPFFLIIDEINRAELSRVFGELMFCLEYRGIKGIVKTQYAQLNNEKTGMLRIGDAYYFFIPHNLYIIGTMNTIDRSIESFDFALRRRFRWEHVNPSYSILKYHYKIKNTNWAGLADSLKQLNKEIAKEPLLGKDYQIGHSYLLNLKYSEKLSERSVRQLVWEDSIGPLIEEYLRGTGQTTERFRKSFGVE